jgi:hypothetical protein
MASGNNKLRSAAKQLSILGAPKGGRARASVLTPAERSAIARRAVQARWEKAGKKKAPSWDEAASKKPSSAAIPELPYSMFRGKLTIGNVEIECHVLSDGRRVLTQREMVRVVTGGREAGDLGRYLASDALSASSFRLSTPIPFRVPPIPQLAAGYEATLLVELCEAYLRARDLELLKSNQLGLAKSAEIVVRACAKVGIIALIDEATGYQEVRDKQNLQLKLQAFIADDMQEWAKMFPDEFWFELARLESIHYSPRHRPLRWGKYVMAFVYDAIDQDVGRELRKRNPDPHYRQNHHQWLKQYGRDKVHDQLQRVVTIMKLCTDMRDFEHKFAKVFQRSPLQMAFDDLNWTQA